MLLLALRAPQPAPGDQAYVAPPYFIWAVLGLLGAGALAWLVAAVLGFTRARAFGASARWFALAAVCLIIYHLQWAVLGLLVVSQSPDLVLSFGAFFNLFVFLAAVCAIIGFTRFTNPEP